MALKERTKAKRETTCCSVNNQDFFSRALFKQATSLDTTICKWGIRKRGQQHVGNCSHCIFSTKRQYLDFRFEQEIMAARPKSASRSSPRIRPPRTLGHHARGARKSQDQREQGLHGLIVIGKENGSSVQEE